MATQRLFINANVVTMDPQRPSADAFLVCGDKFTAVGSAADLRPQTPPDVEVVDLGGATVVPGFIETHNHISYYSECIKMVDCSPYANRDVDEVKERIRERAAQAEPGEWVLGWGYDDTMIGGARHLTRQDLDEVAPNNPVFIMHTSVHLSYTNSRSLALGGITKDTPQPDGGSFDVDENGEPTGVLREGGAQMIVAQHLPAPDVAYYEEALPLAMAEFNRQGVTSVHDGAVGAPTPGDVTWQAYIKMEQEDRLTLRVYTTTMFYFFDHYLQAGLGRGFGSDYLKIGAVKMFQDGSIQGLTGALADDYQCQPGHVGALIRPQEEMDELIARYHSQGQQIACHANGDRAIDSVITAFERAQAKYPQPELRHMIIHCQMATEDQIARMKALKLIPSYFPNHVHYWGDRHESLFIGPDRAARVDPLGSSVRAGLRFTLHADTPVTPISPLHSMHCAVNRITSSGKLLGPDQRITPYEALKAFTVDAAYCSFEEEIKGAVKTRPAGGLCSSVGRPSDRRPHDHQRHCLFWPRTWAAGPCTRPKPDQAVDFSRYVSCRLKRGTGINASPPLLLTPGPVGPHQGPAGPNIQAKSNGDSPDPFPPIHVSVNGCRH